MSFQIIIIALALIGNALGQGLRYNQIGNLNNNYRQAIPLRNNYQQASPLLQYRQPVAVREVAAPVGQAFAPRVQPIRVEQYADETPKPFDFSYSFVDEYGNQQYREEVADANGNVKGRYGYTDANGIYRQAEYTADAYGSQYSIQTNEPGTKTSQPADVVINSDAVEVQYEQPRQQVYQAPVRQVVQAPAKQFFQAPQQLAFRAPVDQQVYTSPLQQLVRGPVRQQYIQPVQNTYTPSQVYTTQNQY